MEHAPAIESLESRRLLADGTAIVIGSVYRDTNHSGTQDNGEVGQAGIRVYLDYNDNGTRDGDAEPIAITNSSGVYTFEHVTPQASLSLRLLLTGTNFQQTAPSTANAPQAVTTVAGEPTNAAAFGVAEPVVVRPTVVAGIVFTDRNADGVRASTDAGRAGVSVYIDTNNDGVREDGEPLTTTDSGGRYLFNEVSPGSKTIRLKLTGTNLVQTTPSGNAGNIVVVTANSENRVALFGVSEIAAQYATIAGTVVTDTNNNAARDAVEPGRANVRVYIDYDLDGKRDNDEPTVLTSSAGKYVFEKVRPTSQLAVRLDLSDGKLSQTFPTNNAGHTLATVAGTRYGDQDFAVREVPPPAKGTLRGHVFLDANGDGVFNSGEKGVGGRIVYIDKNQNGKRDDGDLSQFTAADGSYSFSGLTPASYTLRLIIGDSVQTLPANNGAINVTLQPGATIGDLNFGLKTKAKKKK